VLEALALIVVGAVIGLAGAVAYGQLMTLGLRTWWSGAVGTRALTLHIEPASLIIGAGAVLVAALASIWWTLGRFTRMSTRSLLSGEPVDSMSVRSTSGRRRSLVAASVICAALTVVLLAMATTGSVDRVGAFFGAGASWLAACVCAIAYRLRSPVRRPFAGHGWWAAVRLGARSTVDRPGRSVLAVAVIASAVFILVAVDAFRRAGDVPTDPAAARRSGIGGYPLLVDLQLPLVHDPNSRDGQETLGLMPDDHTTLEPFRVLPGDDASCLNLYEPTSPRVLGVPQRLIESGRFAFQGSLAESDAERANPWLLLNRDFGDATPVIADANSMTYVLHKSLGDDIVLQRGARSIRLRLVAALADSIFQRELLMSEQQFLTLFPDEQGYRFLLAEVQGDATKTAQVTTAIEKTASDLGADVVPTAARLAEFHRVENTYISTFQALGGLGLLVGTLGLGAVVLRNVLERRRELALLGAVGYAPSHVLIMVLSENLVLLGWGLVVGAASALVAIAPSFLDRAAGGPAMSSATVLVLTVFVAGLVSSILATRTALRGRLLDALRAE